VVGSTHISVCSKPGTLLNSYAFILSSLRTTDLPSTFVVTTLRYVLGFIISFPAISFLFVAETLASAGGHVVRTTRNSAFPLIMRAYPSAAFASGNFSIMGRTPVISAKTSVSWESVGMPPAQPLMPFLPKSN
jgi:hypothetical protein